MFPGEEKASGDYISLLGDGMSTGGFLLLDELVSQYRKERPVV